MKRRCTSRRSCCDARRRRRWAPSISSCGWRICCSRRCRCSSASTSAPLSTAWQVSTSAATASSWAGRHSTRSATLTRNLSIGRRSQVGIGCHFSLNAPVTIGDNVVFGHYVRIITDTHEIGPGRRRCGERVPLPVTIGDGVWIASDVTILPGVIVGAGSVVAAARSSPVTSRRTVSYAACLPKYCANCPTWRTHGRGRRSFERSRCGDERQRALNRRRNTIR